MKTTIEISDALLEDAKRLAQRRSTTLRELIERGLRNVLGDQRRNEPFVLRDVRVQGRGLRPELRGADWDRVREAAYEGRGG